LPTLDGKDVFRTAYLFEGLRPEDLSLFREMARYESYAPGEMVISEDDVGADLFLILSGRVRVTKRMPENYEQVIGFMGKGEFFGEMALLDKMSRSASVYAHETTELAVFSHDELLEVFDSRPDLGFRLVGKFAEVLSIRLRNANDKMRAMLHVERSL
jgi:CRP-like cAMP-binding protein